MTTDLWILVAVVGLQWLLVLSAATPRLLTRGIAWSLGARDGDAKDVSIVAHRTQRASDNLAENLPLFAVLVLVVQASGSADATSALGAWIFLGGRLAHAALYIAGVSTLRTVAWAISVGGMFVVGSVLF